MQRIPVTELLALAAHAPVLDVRSPGEYAHAHIPGAHSLPLFSDAERARIGTAYKQQSREAAIKIGLDAFGPNMRAMVEQVEVIAGKNGSKQVLLHCWRGGMRSEAVAWLLDLYGFEVSVLEGGYKAYRQWVLSHWGEANLRIICGYTGTGKTEILHALKALGAPVLDLEGLAKHKGSAFGGLDKIERPTQEQFENDLATEIAHIRAGHPASPIWMEDESQRIGDLNIPHEFFRGRSGAKTVFIDRSFEQRLTRIVSEYGHYPVEALINAIVRIKKRLGPLETKTAIAHLMEGDVEECFRILLRYYDKHYYPAGNGDSRSFDAADKTPEDIAAAIIQHYP